MIYPILVIYIVLSSGFSLTIHSSNISIDTILPVQDFAATFQKNPAPWADWAEVAARVMEQPQAPFWGSVDVGNSSRFIPKYSMVLEDVPTFSPKMAQFGTYSSTMEHLGSTIVVVYGD